MREIYPRSNYKVHEVTYEDEFAKKGGDPYSGKVYGAKKVTAKDGAETWQHPEEEDSSEMLATAAERLIRNPLQFAVDDPGYFNFAVNLFCGHLQPSRWKGRRPGWIDEGALVRL